MNTQITMPAKIREDVLQSMFTAAAAALARHGADHNFKAGNIIMAYTDDDGTTFSDSKFIPPVDKLDPLIVIAMKDSFRKQKEVLNLLQFEK